MDREEILVMVETLKDINNTIQNLKDNPLAVTESDLDILDYNINIFNDLIKNIRR